MIICFYPTLFRGDFAEKLSYYIQRSLIINEDIIICQIAVLILICTVSQRILFTLNELFII